MVLKAEQHSQIAATYERAAADKSLPAQARSAFARKADWFRLLARVGEKREQAALIASKAKHAWNLRRTRFWCLHDQGDGSCGRVTQG